jgi:hypothetical protein
VGLTQDQAKSTLRRLGLKWTSDFKCAGKMFKALLPQLFGGRSPLPVAK